MRFSVRKIMIFLPTNKILQKRLLLGEFRLVSKLFFPIRTKEQDKTQKGRPKHKKAGQNTKMQTKTTKCRPKPQNAGPNYKKASPKYKKSKPNHKNAGSNTKKRANARQKTSKSDHQTKSLKILKIPNKILFLEDSFIFLSSQNIKCMIYLHSTTKFKKGFYIYILDNRMC